MLASECCFEQMSRKKAGIVKGNKGLNYVRTFKENCIVIFWLYICMAVPAGKRQTEPFASIKIWNWKIYKAIEKKFFSDIA